MCVCLCVCVCVCVFGQISSLMHISLNNKDIFCLLIFVYVLLSCCIDFMISGWNWYRKLPQLIGTLVFSVRSWATIRGVYIAKGM